MPYRSCPHHDATVREPPSWEVACPTCVHGTLAATAAVDQHRAERENGEENCVAWMCDYCPHGLDFMCIPRAAFICAPRMHLSSPACGKHLIALPYAYGSGPRHQFSEAQRGRRSRQRQHVRRHSRRLARQRVHRAEAAGTSDRSDLLMHRDPITLHPLTRWLRLDSLFRVREAHQLLIGLRRMYGERSGRRPDTGSAH